MNSLKAWRWPLVLILFAAAGVAASVYRGRTANAGAAAEQPQDVTSLERRISQLEQRLYTIEATLNRLDRQSMLSESRPAPSASARDVDYTLLRTEVGTLQRRLLEDECGLVRLDERTLTPAAREARRRSGANSSDPCRLNADAPLRLSTRP